MVVVHWKNLRQTLSMAKQIFEFVRLVDPVKMSIVTVNEQGVVEDLKKNCFSIWKRDFKCENCPSLYAYNQEISNSKNEIMGEKSFHVLSDTICVEDRDGVRWKLVFEVISETLPKQPKEGDTILVVDDQEINRLIVGKILESHYKVMEAGSGKEALELLKKNKNKISAIILDLIMPEMDGYETLRQLRMNADYRKIPVMVMTGDADAKIEKRCLELGAWDYVLKPVWKETILLRLKNIISRSCYENEKFEQYVAEHDSLTGVFNRTKFFEEVRKKRKKKKDNAKEYAFMRLDLDRFRLFNAFFGEHEGDRLLVYVAQTIRESLRENKDIVFGRMEADIFCVYGCNDREKMEQFIDMVVERLKIYKDHYYIEPSVGIYVDTEPDIAVEGLYARASMASESCKHKFMTNIGYYDDTMTKRLMEEQQIMNEAQRALDEGQFQVYLQPKTNIHTEESQGAEVLVRWLHPEKGIISPANFIPIFESNGFIGRLDFYMWENTCKLLRKWLDDGLEPSPVSVNVSRANMYNLNLTNILKCLVEKYNIPTKLFQLELTESAFMDNPDMMIERVKELRENGFTVLMDDFGSGYSSLNTLKDIPVDILKVDMKFLGSNKKDGKSERILASVVRMAGWLGLSVIVEGVETKEQKNFLESIGCEYVQGFYYARPMHWEDYEETLRRPKKRQQEFEKQTQEDALQKIWNVNKEMERVFSTIVQPVAVYKYQNKKITLLQANNAFGKNFGYGDKAAYRFESNSATMTQECVARIRGSFEKCIDAGNTEYCDFMRLEEDKSRWYRIRMEYLSESEEGHIVLGFFYDIDDEKNLEQEIKRYRNRI